MNNVLNYYFITGTSGGIGKALATQLLKNTKNRVIGISRTNTISHPNYTHHAIDLSNLDLVANFRFIPLESSKKVYLINNAGTLGSVKPIGKLQAIDIIKGYALNLIAPSVLTNSFINTYENVEAEKVIVNISSGAGKNPIDGWAIYCSSKAGIDLFSRVVALEQEIQQQTNPLLKKFNIFSIAPGVVDTNMQVQIRNTEKENFSRVADFINYKTNNELSSPENVSKKYLQLLADITTIKNIVSSIKDYD
ncbi:MAG: SDR family NAD(P)-dependent oxidoreductase [Bacteroidia bacterium]